MNKVLRILFAFCFVLMVLNVTAFAEKPKFDLDWYGYIKLDASYDDNRTSHGNFAMWAQNSKDDDQFNMTANQTRFGLKAFGKDYYDVDVTAQLEFDLYGSVSGATVAENKAMLQLRHAYFSVKYENFKLVAGQTWDIISPLNPSTINYSVVWGIGNIGYRRPQVSFWYTAPAGDETSVTFGAGMFRTIGSDLVPTFTLSAGEMADGQDDGTDAAIPSMQGIVDFKHTFESGAAMRMGVSGLWGKLKAETTMGSYEEYESYCVNGHLSVAPTKQFGIKGEVYTGQNLGSYMGGILNSNTVEGIETFGGWGSAWFKPAPKFTFNVGGGVDNPQDEDLSSSSRSYNRVIFGNVNYDIVEQFTIGLEVSQIQTKYVDASDDAESLRAQTSFKLNF